MNEHTQLSSGQHGERPRGQTGLPQMVGGRMAKSGP